MCNHDIFCNIQLFFFVSKHGKPHHNDNDYWTHILQLLDRDATDWQKNSRELFAWLPRWILEGCPRKLRTFCHYNILSWARRRQNNNKFKCKCSLEIHICYYKSYGSTTQRYFQTRNSSNCSISDWNIFTWNLSIVAFTQYESFVTKYLISKNSCSQYNETPS